MDRVIWAVATLATAAIVLPYLMAFRRRNVWVNRIDLERR